jgi:hypothetical protein
MSHSTSGFDERTDDFPFDPPARSGNRLAWLFVGLLALVVFELTADPALTVVVGCIKFGWDELATARWLWWTDPDRLRGRVTSLFYAAWSLCRITGIAIVLMLVAILVFGLLTEMGLAGGAKMPSAPRVLTSIALVVLCGLVSTGLTLALALFSARRNRIKVWIGPEAKLARRSGTWPPGSIEGKTGQTNLAYRLILALVITIAVPLILVLSILPMCLMPGPPQPGPIEVVFGIFVALNMIVALLVVPIALIFTLGSLAARVLATSPEECWLFRDIRRVAREDGHSWGLPQVSDG